MIARNVSIADEETLSLRSFQREDDLGDPAPAVANKPKQRLALGAGRFRAPFGVRFRTRTCSMSGTSALRHRPTEHELSEVVAQLRAVYALKTLEMTLQAGRLIVQVCWGGNLACFRRRGTKDLSLRKLASRPDLPMSASALFRAVAVYELCERLPHVPGSKHLVVSHLHAVLGLPDQRQAELLELAERERWTVARLAREVAREPRSVNRGRPRLPRFVKTIRALRKFAHHDELFSDVDALENLGEFELYELADTVAKLRDRCEAMDILLSSELGSRRPPLRPGLPFSYPRELRH